MTPPLVIRAPATDQEKNFCRKSWSANYSKYRPARIAWVDGYPEKTTQMPLGLYYQEHARYVDSVLERGAVRIATSPKYRDVILGFLAVEEEVLHYIYVPSPFRRMGVARALLSEYVDRPMVMVNWVSLLEHLPFPSNWIYNEVRKWR